MHQSIALLLLCSLACSHGPQSSVRPVVQYPVPSSGFAIGSPDAEVTVLEFGSFGCRYCKEFHDSIVPQLKSGKHGPVRFRFIAVDTLQPFLQLALWAHCMTVTVGAEVALDSTFAIVASAFAKEGHDPGKSVFSGEMLDCRSKDSAEHHEEARRASAFGIRAIPTFIVGVEEDGYVRGWFVEGIKMELLMQTLDSVRLRISQRHR